LYSATTTILLPSRGWRRGDWIDVRDQSYVCIERSVKCDRRVESQQLPKIIRHAGKGIICGACRFSFLISYGNRA
jgi:hypothetical protein